MFALIFLAAGFVVWLRYTNRLRRGARERTGSDSSNALPGLFGIIMRIRFGGVLTMIVPFLFGVFLDRLLGTTIEDIFG